MNKAELVAAIAERCEMSKKDAENCLNETIDIIQEALKNKKDGKVALVGFGTFALAERKAREGINPLTKEKIKIPKCKVVKFKCGKALKDAMN